MVTNSRPGRCLRLAAALIIGLALVVGLAPAALADGEEPEPNLPPTQLVVTDVFVSTNPTTKIIGGVIFYLRYPDGSNAEAGVLAHTSAFSCGHFLQELTMPPSDGSLALAGVMFSPDGKTPPVRDTAITRRVGKSIQYQIDVIQPGYDAYHLTGEITSYGVVDGKDISESRPSCLELDNPLHPKWSKKKEKRKRAVVGRRISVTPTTAPGARITYTWRFVNRWGVLKKTVGTGRSIRVKRDWVGHRLAVVVKVKKARYHGQSKTIAFPKVHRRH